MDCRLIGAKPLPELMLTYCPWDHHNTFQRNCIQSTNTRDVEQCRHTSWNGYAIHIIDIHSTLQWCHNGHDGVLNHQPHHCLLNSLCRCRSKKTSKLRVIGLCGEVIVDWWFPAQMASNAETVSIWWRHHDYIIVLMSGDRINPNYYILIYLIIMKVLPHNPHRYCDDSAFNN